MVSHPERNQGQLALFWNPFLRLLLPLSLYLVSATQFWSSPSQPAVCTMCKIEVWLAGLWPDGCVNPREIRVGGWRGGKPEEIPLLKDYQAFAAPRMAEIWQTPDTLLAPFTGCSEPTTQNTLQGCVDVAREISFWHKNVWPTLSVGLCRTRLLSMGKHVAGRRPEKADSGLF